MRLLARAASRRASNPGAFVMLALCTLLAGAHASAATLQVGPQRDIRTVAEAARRAQPGDVVQIDQGVYDNDYAVWRSDNVTVRGLGSGAHMRSSGLIPNGKAIWLALGKDIRIENIEFSGARVKDGNGAGIRQEAGTLLLKNTYFHDNQFGIMTANRLDAELHIEDSRFARHHRSNGIAHGIYAGTIARFSLTGSHVTGTEGGHHVKSRALENRILYNRLEDGANMPTSRIVDLSNCGLSLVIGNEFLQKKVTQNINVIGYGAEGCDGRTASQMQLFVVHNTLVNEAFNSVFVRNHAHTEVVVGNNLLLGPGRFLTGGGTATGNLQLGRDQRRGEGWLPRSGEGVTDAAVAVTGPDGSVLVAGREFRAPAGSVARPTIGQPDIGARELAGQ